MNCVNSALIVGIVVLCMYLCYAPEIEGIGYSQGWKTKYPKLGVSADEKKLRKHQIREAKYERKKAFKHINEKYPKNSIKWNFYKRHFSEQFRRTVFRINNPRITARNDKKIAIAFGRSSTKRTMRNPSYNTVRPSNLSSKYSPMNTPYESRDRSSTEATLEKVVMNQSDVIGFQPDESRG